MLHFSASPRCDSGFSRSHDPGDHRSSFTFLCDLCGKRFSTRRCLV